MKSIYDLTYEQLLEWTESVAWKKYQAKQIFQWLYRHRVASFEAMSDLSIEKRALLVDTFALGTVS